jgi:hypothetical protein
MDVAVGNEPRTIIVLDLSGMSFRLTYIGQDLAGQGRSTSRRDRGVSIMDGREGLSNIALTTVAGKLPCDERSLNKRLLMKFSTIWIPKTKSPSPCAPTLTSMCPCQPIDGRDRQPLQNGHALLIQLL